MNTANEQLNIEELERAAKLEQYLQDLDAGRTSDVPFEARDDEELLHDLARTRDMYYATKDIEPRKEFVDRVEKLFVKTAKSESENESERESVREPLWMRRFIPLSITGATLAVILVSVFAFRTMFLNEGSSNPLVFVQDEDGAKVLNIDLDDLVNTTPDPTTTTGSNPAMVDPEESNKENEDDIPFESGDEVVEPAEPPKEVPKAGIAASNPNIVALIGELDTDIVFADTDADEDLVFAGLASLDTFMTDVEAIEF